MRESEVKELKDVRGAVDEIVARTGTGAEHVIPLLHAIQKRYNYLPEEAVRRVCETTDITPADITGISTFYTQFRHHEVGRHIIQVCTGTACHLKGAELVYDAFLRELKIGENLDTDPEGLFTVQKVACLGCCTIAPVVQIDRVTYGHVQSNRTASVLQDFLNRQDDGKERAGIVSEDGGRIGEIKIGLGSCCIASGSRNVQRALEEVVSENGLQARVKRVGCVGMCHRTPLLEVCPKEGDPVLYDKVRPEDVRRIVLSHNRPRSLARRIRNSFLDWVDHLLLDEPERGFSRHPLHMRDPDIRSFLDRQVHITTEHSGQIDPLDLDEYRKRRGFEAAGRCLTAETPEKIIGLIAESGLRGRGGAGFPTGDKWALTRRASGQPKYIICNGDEGDPGAFMDRMILESYPYRVIEGMIIAAFVVGAEQGVFYIRAEYPLAVERVDAALKECRKEGLLGKNIFGSGFSLDLTIMEGAGAFVCGEETALIASVEGKRGNPSYRPPYPAQQGLWGKPTLVNNCETLATVPWIIREGTEPFLRLGTDKSKGTKVFSLAGKVARGGLIEVPMGITISEVVEEIGGGIEHGRRFKAVQIGGPSGGCVPAELADIKVDYEDLTRAGAMMGSGGLLVMDETDCMVDIARYFLTFTCSQSCGKCTFCRIGTRRMLRLLENITEGKGKKEDLQELEEVALRTREGSLCGLGKTAPNPVLTTLKYFREEFEAHLEGRCPAQKCKALITYTITDECIGCTICAQMCPAKTIPLEPYKKHEIYQPGCIKCGTCRQVCPSQAVEIR